MLIETVAFNFQEVGEYSFDAIKNSCLRHFASSLEEAITSKNPRIRKFWVDFGVTYGGDEVKGSVANYKIFSDLFGNKIKFNSKSVVFEETLTNDPNKLWNVRSYCMNYYNLEYVAETDEHSAYYRYKNRNKGSSDIADSCCECATNEEFVGGKRDEAEEMLRHFYTAFGVGEFPFLTICIVRLGNKDHFFYRIHR